MIDEEIDEYNNAMGKIRLPIEHLLDLTYFKILTEKQKPRIQTVTYEKGQRKWKDGIGIYQPLTGNYRWRCKSSNPFLIPFQTPKGIFSFHPDIINRVKAVREFLESQKTTVWDK